MEGEVGIVVDATRQASKFLLRDYFELENLQSSTKSASASSFGQKSCTKMLQILQERLAKYFHTIIFDSKEVESSKFVGKAALVEVLDGFTNLTRSLPFFGIMVTILTNKNGQIMLNRPCQSHFTMSIENVTKFQQFHSGFCDRMCPVRIELLCQCVI